ncbi:MAG: hypothetical protein BWY78_00264 [Alphaproteobacteria bacterium ADurb.Bin438]|nr:MAG: hypothetical protein BWY78_00264 [Alphaproteobacteria bacterium ADurb.Bin438]
MTSEERKLKSIEILKKKNIPYIDHLPVICSAQNIKLRSKEDIAKRAATLLIVSGYAGDVVNNNDIIASKEFFYENLRKYDLVGNLTEREEKFFINDIPLRNEALQLVWQYESCYALLWSLGLVNTLFFPDKTCSEGSISYLLAKCNSFDEFYQKTKLRNVNEILDEADLIYRYHWAIVDARLKRISPPAKLEEGVVLERHRALNWVINHNNEDWDNVRVDT